MSVSISHDGTPLTAGFSVLLAGKKTASPKRANRSKIKGKNMPLGVCGFSCGWEMHFGRADERWGMIDLRQFKEGNCPFREWPLCLCSIVRFRRGKRLGAVGGISCWSVVPPGHWLQQAWRVQGWRPDFHESQLSHQRGFIHKNGPKHLATP